jgi:hypothetical protein
MAKKRPPCIRNLKCFEETGCPEREWDGEEGCTAWMEMVVGTKADTGRPKTKRMCIDMWQFDFSFSILGALEGNQQAIESFRNGMVMVDPEGQTHPKPDPGVLSLLNMVHQQIHKQQIIHEHEEKKLLDKDK